MKILRYLFFVFLFLTIISTSCFRMGAGGGSPSCSSPKQEAKPDKSEPVPGAEILIEQEQNDIQPQKK